MSFFPLLNQWNCLFINGHIPGDYQNGYNLFKDYTGGSQEPKGYGKRRRGGFLIYEMTRHHPLARIIHGVIVARSVSEAG
jgi:hypothetical protein